MNDELPDQVQAELKRTLSEIGVILTEANKRLSEGGFSNFATVAASVLHNNPNLFCHVEYSSIVLRPVNESTGAEEDLDEIREVEEVAIYSSHLGEIVEVKSLISSTLTEHNPCNEDNVGKSCGHNKRCKEVYIGGKVVCYLCLPVN